jgi:hypothetical protein
MKRVGRRPLADGSGELSQGRSDVYELSLPCLKFPHQIAELLLPDFAEAAQEFEIKIAAVVSDQQGTGFEQPNEFVPLRLPESPEGGVSGIFQNHGDCESPPSCGREVETARFGSGELGEHFEVKGLNHGNDAVWISCRNAVRGQA